MRRAIVIAFVTILAACSSAPPVQPPEPVEVAHSLNELALEAFRAGRYRQALGAFARAERQFRSLDRADGIAVAAISQAEIRLLLEERNEAKDALRRASEAVRHAGNRYLNERIHLLDARLQLDTNPVQARRELDALLDAAPHIATQARLLLCGMQIDAGETGCASELASGNTLVNASIEQLRARAALVEGDMNAAEAHLLLALSAYRVLAYRPGIADVHAELATLAKRRGNPSLARHHLQRALYLQLWMHSAVEAANLFGRLAELADSVEERQGYLERREELLSDDAEPKWQTLLEELAAFGK